MVFTEAKQIPGTEFDRNMNEASTVERNSYALSSGNRPAPLQFPETAPLDGSVIEVKHGRATTVYAMRCLRIRSSSPSMILVITARQCNRPSRSIVWLGSLETADSDCQPR